MPITRCFTDNELAALCDADPTGEQTLEGFEAIVMGEIAGFIDINKERLNRCIVEIASDEICITAGQIKMACDEQLMDTLSEMEMTLAHKGWPNVSTLLLPGDPDEKALRHYREFCVPYDA